MDLYEKRSGSEESYSKIDELDAIVGNLSLSDLNRVLYRADPEERDDGNGGGVYVLPNTGALVYCGLQGQYRPNGQCPFAKQEQRPHVEVPYFTNIYLSILDVQKKGAL